MCVGGGVLRVLCTKQCSSSSKGCDRGCFGWRWCTLYMAVQSWNGTWHQHSGAAPSTAAAAAARGVIGVCSGRCRVQHT